MTDIPPITVTGRAPYCPPETLVLGAGAATPSGAPSFEGYTSPHWYLDGERTRPMVRVAQDLVLRVAAEAFWEWTTPDGVWSILDIGCEDGWMMSHWSERGYHVRGITHCPEGLPSHALVGDMHTFHLMDEDPFDAVWLFRSLERALVPLVVLRNAYRHLRPNGRLWIALRLGEWSAFERQQSVLTPEWLKDLVTQAGFVLQRSDVQVIGGKRMASTYLWLECNRQD